MQEKCHSIMKIDCMIVMTHSFLVRLLTPVENMGTFRTVDNQGSET